MVRSTILGIGLAVAALVASIHVTGCGDSGGGGGSTGTAGSGGSGDSGGSTGTAGTTGTGGTTGVAGTTGQGGTSSTGTAGSGTAGSSTAGTAGATGTGGATGAGGTTGAFGQPACLGTVTKGGACAATDQQLCFKTCGPQSRGVKSETCTNAVYVEMTGCNFDPANDYSCYKLPAAANAMCPTTPPQAGQACTVDMCNACNSTGGLPGGTYLDSSAMSKTGWCVCQPPNGAGNRTWSCASDTAWPCTATGGAPGCI